MLAAPAVAHAAAGPIEIVDVVGRRVTLARPARRIVTGAWLSLDALAMIHPDPVSLLAAWQGGPGATLDEGQHAELVTRFPAVTKLPSIGRFTLDGASTEAVIALKPDLVVLSVFDAFGMAGGAQNPQLRIFGAAGVPVIVLDFFLDPLGKSETSLEILGRAIGREEQARAYNAFYRARRDEVARRLAGAGDGLKRPNVFMHVHAASPDCCYSPGHATLNEFINLAGGHNIGVDVLKGATGQLSLEYVLTRNPDVYVATGTFEREAGRFAVGRGVAPERVHAGLKSLMTRPGLSTLKAVASGDAHALWHAFAHTPAHVVAIERLASWFHPELFEGLDPQATLDEINAHFTSLPMNGAFWATL